MQIRTDDPRFLLLFAWAAACLPAAAQTPWGNVNQGMSEAELQAALPAVEQVRRPPVGPHGMRGLWALPHTPLAGIPFDTTFYFKDRRLQQVEQIFTDTPGSCTARPSFDRLVSILRARYGQELTARDPAGGGANYTSSWVAGDTDVVASVADSPARCSIRLIWRERVVKDADEL